VDENSTTNNTDSDHSVKVSSEPLHYSTRDNIGEGSRHEVVEDEDLELPSYIMPSPKYR
jgi:hypothetical protein